MNLFKDLGMKVSIMAGRTGLKVKKHSPELFLGAGIATFAITVVTASKATLKLNDILKEERENLIKIREFCDENPESEYAVEDAARDKLICYSKMAVETVKLYAPSVFIGMVSIGCIITSRNITHRRYLAAVCAYEGVAEAFRTYRERVVLEGGEALDRHYRYGTDFVTETETIVDENGKKKKVETVKQELLDPSKIPNGVTCVFFDETNPNWDPNNGFNKHFLSAQMDYMTNILNARGHLFLNEVYRNLGFPHTSEGAIMGWIKKPDRENFVDFGIYKPTEGARAFMNGRENIVLLDFNIDGVIFDKI